MRKRQIEPSHNEDERIVPANFLTRHLAIFPCSRYNAVHVGG
jgi:hypothetical protein